MSILPAVCGPGKALTVVQTGTQEQEPAVDHLDTARLEPSINAPHLLSSSRKCETAHVNDEQGASAEGLSCSSDPPPRRRFPRQRAKLGSPGI